MFNISTNITLPKLGDAINTSHIPPDIFGIFTYIWILNFGGWFFAAIFGIIGAALYIKYDNAVVPVAFFIIMVILFGNVIGATEPGIPTAGIFVFFIGAIAAFVLGFLLYQLFISKEE
jgi:hypothetical protein